MPNRMLRDCTDSESVNRLGWQAEVLFYRLIMKADDYGRYHADPQLLKSYLFPRKEIRTADIARWVAECETSGLIACYVGADGKPYAAIRNFKQRTRAKISKFPDPPWGDKEPPPYDGHMSVIRQSYDSHASVMRPLETETRDEKINTHTAQARIRPYPETVAEIKNAAASPNIAYAITDEEAEKFLADGRATGWRWKNQPIEDWTQLLIRWKLASQNIPKQKGGDKNESKFSKYKLI